MQPVNQYRSAASVLLLRDSPQKKKALEVLLLERPSTMSFGGSWVFPGGCLEAQDRSDVLIANTTGLSDVDAGVQLQLPNHARSWWLAAVRELFEETGILLATNVVDEAAVAEGREALLVGATSFPDLVQRCGWSFDLASIHYQSFWIAPDWVAPRYATRFFVAALPQAQSAVAKSAEALDLQWFQPAEALQQQARLKLPRPTAENLKLLLEFDSVQSALNAIAIRDKPATPAIWPNKVDGAVSLQQVPQSLEGLNIQLLDGAGTTADFRHD
jgi:8-oxo-dGTP pyrophosphatase MutT (NUDIX family)